MRWLVEHPQIQMYDHEIHSLKNDKPGELAELMYALPEGNQYKRGYKSPNDIVQVKSMNSIRTYWPETKLVVGVRYVYITRYGISCDLVIAVSPIHHFCLALALALTLALSVAARKITQTQQHTHTDIL